MTTSSRMSLLIEAAAFVMVLVAVVLILGLAA